MVKVCPVCGLPLEHDAKGPRGKRVRYWKLKQGRCKSNRVCVSCYEKLSNAAGPKAHLEGRKA